MTTSGSGTPVPPIYPGADARARDEQHILGDLVETFVDGVRGYRTAADQVDDPDLAGFMRERAEERRTLVEELVRVTRLDEGGGEVDFDGTPSGGLHRAWLAIKGEVAGDDAVVKAAIKGEEHALEQCEEALGEGLPEAGAAIVRRAATDIRGAIDSLFARVT